ncbi:hypothetical protein BCR37DRAFT_257914 [Protomyces lactucae-debilis]|uniref:Uncharacterized protein n=1 Tax=Protomyces lactucae-debilis TaxID=2754530 RepID=A0A1Y2FQV4_PROLT|nr:uncharacterized protein BCR37DRAFT_257914 [Protomyces lactucae-debilis]ORY85095.1 hypothetical protein BCR37DRAFT_257914 [Protomyces lactucae-debilis]
MRPHPPVHIHPHIMEDISVMRALLLLSATHRKLNLEDSIYDSSSPLKAIQLAGVAGRLNARIYAEETAGARIHTAAGARSLRSPLYESIIAESDDEEDSDAHWTDHGLAQMSTAIEVGTGQREIPNQVIELLDEEEKPLRHIDEDYDAPDYEMDDEAYDDDMPMLSRQTSHVFGESSSSSSSASDDDEQEETEESEEVHAKVDDAKAEEERIKHTFYMSCNVPPSAFQLSAHGEQKYRPAILQESPPMAAAMA